MRHEYYLDPEAIVKYGRKPNSNYICAMYYRNDFTRHSWDDRGDNKNRLPMVMSVQLAVYDPDGAGLSQVLVDGEACFYTYFNSNLNYATDSTHYERFILSLKSKKFHGVGVDVVALTKHGKYFVTHVRVYLARKLPLPEGCVLTQDLSEVASKLGEPLSQLAILHNPELKRIFKNTAGWPIKVDPINEALPNPTKLINVGFRFQAYDDLEPRIAPKLKLTPSEIAKLEPNMYCNVFPPRSFYIGQQHLDPDY